MARAGDEPWRLTEEALRAGGSRVALCGAGPELTYEALADRARAVADALRALGVGPGGRVALVSAGRGHDEAVALAGVLACGASAVPLDAGSPPLRLAGIVERRGCQALVHDAPAARLAAGIEESLSAPVGRLVLADDGAVAERTPGGSDHRGGGEGTLDEACVLHTSGSTGTPKAVPITWAGLDAFTGWMLALLDLGPGDRVLRVAELIFDLAWFDHLATWRAGATLCTMSRRQLAAGRAVRAQLEELRPSVVYGVPSLFMKLEAALEPGAVVHPELRHVCFAGEVFPPRELAAFALRAPGARLFNLFGPTETNVCTYHEVRRSELDGERELPIGLPCPYAACSLVDDAGAVLDGPATGELVVAGPTALGGLFATRDRVERRDGLFYFRGRLDRMVKIRGYRVEPGEVEAALVAHPAVREAAVVTREHARLGTVLTAFVTARDLGDELDARALKKHLAARLAAYMVPEDVVPVDELDRTATGKIDYGSLAARSF